MQMSSEFLVPVLLGACLAAVIAPFLVKRPLLRLAAAAFLVYVVVVEYEDELRVLFETSDSTTQREVKIINLASGTYLVTAKKLNVRIAPNSKGEVVTSLDQGQEVFVHETIGSYARISDYFEGSGYGKSGNIAQWVGSEYLTVKEGS